MSSSSNNNNSTQPSKTGIYVIITKVWCLTNGDPSVINFSLKSTDPCGTILVKYYEPRHGEYINMEKFRRGGIWKITLYKDSDEIESIERTGIIGDNLCAIQ